jgi:hypothetical protein
MNGKRAGNSSTYLLRLKNLEIRSAGIIDFSQDVETTLKFCERRRRSAFHRLDGGVSAASASIRSNTSTFLDRFVTGRKQASTASKKNVCQLQGSSSWCRSVK